MNVSLITPRIHKKLNKECKQINWQHYGERQHFCRQVTQHVTRKRGKHI